MGVPGDEIQVCRSGRPRPSGEAAGEAGAGEEPAASGTTQLDQSPSPRRRAPALKHTAGSPGVNPPCLRMRWSELGLPRCLNPPVVTPGDKHRLWPRPPRPAAPGGSVCPHPDVPVVCCDKKGTLVARGALWDGESRGWGQRKGSRRRAPTGEKNVRKGNLAKRMLQPLGPKGDPRLFDPEGRRQAPELGEPVVYKEKQQDPGWSARRTRSRAGVRRLATTPGIKTAVRRGE